MPRQHPESLSPDPLYGRDGAGEIIASGDAAGMRRVRLAPWRVADADAPAALAAAAERDPWADQPAERLRPHPDVGARIVCDFGAELEGELELAVEARGPATIFCTVGESLPEAMAWGLPPAPAAGFAPAKQALTAPAGRSRLRCDARGFRFARIDAFDGGGEVLVAPRAAARFAGGARVGDFRCADPLVQRLWQASAYTARACTRADAFWDGPKRDRHGWYGDARITQQTYDAVFADPVPAERMLLAWPERAWANGIPGFSFDAIAMFRQLLAAHGAAREAVPAIWSRMRGFLAWVLGTQVDARLRLTRRDDVEYFFGIGFIDWSPQPLGGRFEELPWLQCQWREALATAATIARWLGHEAEERAWREAGEPLARLIAAEHWRPGGWPHTLARATPGEDWAMPHQPGLHHRLSYLEGKNHGPSRTSRHAIARAALAGVVDGARRAESLAALDDPTLPGIITPFYQFYEQWARAMLGDPAGGLARFVSYLERMLLPNDGATVWESFEPEVTGFGRWSLHGFPKSLCHGWGSGLVPFAQRWLLGVEPLAPGFAEVALHDSSPAPCAFAAAIPTPRGPLRVTRDAADAPTRIDAPPGVRVVRAGEARA